MVTNSNFFQWKEVQGVMLEAFPSTATSFTNHRKIYSSIQKKLSCSTSSNKEKLKLNALIDCVDEAWKNRAQNDAIDPSIPKILRYMSAQKIKHAYDGYCGLAKIRQLFSAIINFFFYGQFATSAGRAEQLAEQIEAKALTAQAETQNKAQDIPRALSSPVVLSSQDEAEAKASAVNLGLSSTPLMQNDTLTTSCYNKLRYSKFYGNLDRQKEFEEYVAGFMSEFQRESGSLSGRIKVIVPSLDAFENPERVDKEWVKFMVLRFGLFSSQNADVQQFARAQYHAYIERLVDAGGVIVISELTEFLKTYSEASGIGKYDLYSTMLRNCEGHQNQLSFSVNEWMRHLRSESQMRNIQHHPTDKKLRR